MTSARIVRVLPASVYLDTSILTAAVFRGSDDHQAAFDYCQQLAKDRSIVYFSQLLRFEFLQSARVIGTTPGATFPSTRRKYHLARWGGDQAVRERWMTDGASHLDEYLAQFARVVEAPLDMEIWRRTVVLMAEHHLKSYDAAHIATAIELGVPRIASRDADFARVTSLSIDIVRDVDAPRSGA